MLLDTATLPERARKAKPETARLFTQLKRRKPAELDAVMGEIHREVFAETDCLACANCCRTTSPIFYQADIRRLAQALKLTPAAFMDTYLRQDEDGDWVLRQAPCPFLNTDNTCAVYTSRPTVCREYPHTDRKRFYQLLDLTLRNTEICPAVFEIVARLREVVKTTGFR